MKKITFKKTLSLIVFSLTTLGAVTALGSLELIKDVRKEITHDLYDFAQINAPEMPLKLSLNKVHTYITRDENRLDYKRINQNLSSYTSKLTEHSIYLKSISTSVSSNITGDIHKSLVEKSISLLKNGLFNLNFNLQAELEDPGSEEALNISSIDLKLNFSRQAVKGILKKDFIDSFKVNFDSKLRTFNILKSSLGIEYINKYCDSDNLEKSPRLKEVFKLSCVIANKISDAKNFKSMLKDVEADLKNLKSLLDDSIKKLIKEKTGTSVGASLLYKISTLSNLCKPSIFKIIGTCTPGLEFSAEGGAFGSKFDASLIITENSLTLKTNTDVGKAATAILEKPKDEYEADFLAKHYINLKTIESISPKDLNVFLEDAAERIDMSIELIEDSLQR